MKSWVQSYVSEVWFVQWGFHPSLLYPIAPWKAAPESWRNFWNSVECGIGQGGHVYGSFAPLRCLYSIYIDPPLSLRTPMKYPMTFRAGVCGSQECIFRCTATAVGRTEWESPTVLLAPPWIQAIGLYWQGCLTCLMQDLCSTLESFYKATHHKSIHLLPTVHFQCIIPYDQHPPPSAHWILGRTDLNGRSAYQERKKSSAILIILFWNRQINQMWDFKCHFVLQSLHNNSINLYYMKYLSFTHTILRCVHLCTPQILANHSILCMYNVNWEIRSGSQYNDLLLLSLFNLIFRLPLCPLISGAHWDWQGRMQWDQQ